MPELAHSAITCWPAAALPPLPHPMMVEVVPNQTWGLSRFASDSLRRATGSTNQVDVTGRHQERAALLIIIVALSDGRKVLLACESGQPENTESWGRILRDLRKRA